MELLTSPDQCALDVFFLFVVTQLFKKQNLCMYDVYVLQLTCLKFHVMIPLKKKHQLSTFSLLVDVVVFFFNFSFGGFTYVESWPRNFFDIQFKLGKVKLRRARRDINIQKYRSPQSQNFPKKMEIKVCRFFCFKKYIFIQNSRTYLCL